MLLQIGYKDSIRENTHKTLIVFEIGKTIGVAAAEETSRHT